MNVVGNKKQKTKHWSDENKVNWIAWNATGTDKREEKQTSALLQSQKEIESKCVVQIFEFIPYFSNSILLF